MITFPHGKNQILVTQLAKISVFQMTSDTIYEKIISFEYFLRSDLPKCIIKNKKQLYQMKNPRLDQNVPRFL